MPHTRLTDDFVWCAYSMKVAKFAKMMTDQGMRVVTYGNGDAELPGDYVAVTDETFPDHYIAEFDRTKEPFLTFNAKAEAAIRETLERDDVICVIGGVAQESTRWAFPCHPVVEFGVGYTGVFAQYKVFESYTWQHYVYGRYGWDGSEHDTVIPNYFDLADFASSRDREYFAFLGRVCHVKGVDIAVEACQRAGVPLKIAGHVYEDAEYVKHLRGDIEYVGNLDPEGRKAFLASAVAVLTPSRYVEPFCGVHVEALLSGAPPICPDWGVFTETVSANNGYRCRTVDDYEAAVRRVAHFHDDRQTFYSAFSEGIRRDASSRYSLEAVGPKYVDYLSRVAGK